MLRMKVLIKCQLLRLLGVTLCLYTILKIKYGGNTRRFKIRPINRARRVHGGFQYFQKMKHWDNQQFFKYTRLDKPAFLKLLNLIKPKIKTQLRADGILPEERLVITLQYLSQGMSMQSLSWTFHIGHTTVHKIIKEMCHILCETLCPLYLQTPNTAEKWQNIVKDIGAYGSQSDGGIFKNSIFGQKLENDNMNIFKKNKLPNSNTEIPNFFVADEAFPLKKYIMRPYPGKNLSYMQKNFNYILSRARQVIENTFGIARWRILGTNINTDVNNIDNIIKAVVVLHNYCQSELPHDYCPCQFVDKDGKQDREWRKEQQMPLQSVGRMSSNVSRRDLYNMRDTLANYLISEGKVPWQDEVVNRDLLLT